MKLARRDVLKSLAVSGSLVSLTNCEKITSTFNREWLGEGVPKKLVPAQDREIDPDFHRLSRASFGPWPGDLQRLKSMGWPAWLEEQLTPDSIQDLACDLRAERFESIYFSAGDAYEFRKPVLRDELTRHALLRAIYSRRQLFEVMVEFWTDHLNIDLEKGDCIYLKPSDDRDVIRKHALGNFHELIRASATSPAMLVYLDGKTNRVRKGSSDQPNENYARELMELHTMGVHGGYSQADVREAARCLTGWTFDTKRFFALNQGESYFRPDWHDDGEKNVLGHTIAAKGGAKDIDALVRIVCQHPSTARFIAEKLCHRFVSMTPPATLVQSVASEFTRTQGDIKSMLRILLNSDEFLASRGQLLKRPFRFVVSALRALAADTHAEKGVIEPLQRMGHGLFQYPTPDGYPDEELPWMGTLMWRWNFALALAAGKQSAAQVDLPAISKALGDKTKKADAAQWFAHLIGRAPSESEKKALTPILAGKEAESLPLMVGLILASPAFQRC